VLAGTDLAICSISLDILLKSVGVKVGSDPALDPEKFIAKFWKSIGMWSLATDAANREPLFQVNIHEATKLQDLPPSKIDTSSCATIVSFTEEC